MHAYTEQIQRWEDQLNAGESVQLGPSELDRAIILALIRRKRGAGPDRTDPLAPKAEALIDA